MSPRGDEQAGRVTSNAVQVAGLDRFYFGRQTSDLG
jgi:hypothetical protein